MKTVGTIGLLIVLGLHFCANVRGGQLKQELDAYLRKMARADRFSGSALVAVGGKVVLNTGYGFANRELGVPNSSQTKFRIGSLSKQFTAMAIMILQERVKLKVEDTACKFVPDCPSAWSGITLQQLLTHTSGIPDLLGFPEFGRTMALPSPLEQTVARFKNKPLDFPAGSQFRYSNSGYVLLGYIIERVSGQTYDSFLKETIFDPLTMTETGNDRADLILPNRASGYVRHGDLIFNAPYIDMSIATGGGSLYSTTEDLFRWDRALSEQRLLHHGSYEQMFKTYAIADWGDGAAFGWFEGRDEAGHRYLGFQGGINGFASQIMRYPDQKILIVLLSNYSFTRVGELEKDMSKMVFAELKR